MDTHTHQVNKCLIKSFSEQPVIKIGYDRKAQRNLKQRKRTPSSKLNQSKMKNTVNTENACKPRRKQETLSSQVLERIKAFDNSTS